MKKHILLLAALAMLFSCSNNNPKPDKPAQPDTNKETTVNTIDTDTVSEPTTDEDITEAEQPYFYVETYQIQDHRPATSDGEETGENLMSFECVVDIPVTDNQALYDSICQWFAHYMYDGYYMDPRDVKAMTDRYKDAVLDPDNYGEPDGFDASTYFKMVEANDHYVTYRRYDFFEAFSSPRANQEENYVTFDRETGKRFTREMIDVDEDLKEMVMNALFEQYFSEWDPEDLGDLLFFDPDFPEDYGFFLPQYTDPWILNDYIYFGYGEHEIADRCTGQPACGLSYSEMEPYLTEEGREFFR